MRDRPSSPPDPVYRSSPGTGPGAGAGDARILAPTFERNSPPIIARLTPWLDPLSGPVLEIGAGTGQHAAAMALAFPRLQWWPSEPDALQRASIVAWQRHLRAPARAPLNIDAASAWSENREVRALGPLCAVVSMNVIHISPVDVAHGIVAGAAEALRTGGLLIFYGPFMENGEHTGAGNAQFDRQLRARNPAWGLRDLADVTAWCARRGLAAADVISMPANNRLALFRKD